MKASAHNQKTIDEFQAKKGRGVGIFGDHVLLMTAKGAKSGDAITCPLVYGRDGKDYVIVASKGGAPDNPQWFGNLKANPDVEIQGGNGQRIETLKAQAVAVGARALRLLGRLEPGIPKSVIEGGNWSGVEVVSKSGAFGAADVLRKLLKQNGLI